MSDRIRLTLIVCRDEDGEPVVCGAWETNLLDIIDGDEVDGLFAKAKAQWMPDYVDWREIQVTVDRASVLQAFNSPVLDAHVEP